jgi:hypothetical protein
MSLLEPTVVPGLDRALLELFLFFGGIISAALVLTISSIVGIIRAVRRRRQHRKSTAAVLLAAGATSITILWLLYWTTDNVYHRLNPIDGFLLLNSALCLLPLSWLIAAFRANSTSVPDR